MKEAKHETTKNYLIVGFFEGTRQSTERRLNQKDYDSLKLRIGKHSRTKTYITAIYELDD